MYTLFYFPRNASFAPHMLLAHLGVPYQLELVDRKSAAQKSDAYLALNPTGRIPTLVDDQTVLFESAAICLYLSEKHPESHLIPSLGTTERATFHQWLFYLTASLQPELMMYFYPERHTESDGDSQAIKRAQEERLTEMFALLDKKLANSAFLCGSTLTACDYFLFMLAHWGSGLSAPPLSFPNLRRFLAQMANQPAVKTVCDKEGTSLKVYINQ